MHIEGQPRDDLIQIAVLDAQLPQLLEVAKQLAVDVILDLRHGGYGRGLARETAAGNGLGRE